MKRTQPSEIEAWDAAFEGASPTIKHATAQKTTCNEDVVFAEEKGGEGLSWELFCICDGHCGDGAAQHIRRHLWSSLERRLPTTKPERRRGFYGWATEIRSAFVEAFAELDRDFGDALGDDGDSGMAPVTPTAPLRVVLGSTLTVALSCGWFLTVANLGDSEAVIDTGIEIVPMTHSHRLEECENERTRLTEAGVQLARLAPDLVSPAKKGDVGLGPQRCWPGGLANSRSIGDLEGGHHIVSAPYIKQVATLEPRLKWIDLAQCVLPRVGCRLIIGSDGVWDMINHNTACVLTRPNCNKTSADRLVTLAVYRNDWAVHDDTTALVVDFLPDVHQEFPQICKMLKKCRQRAKKPIFSCFCASEVKEMEQDPSSKWMPIAEIDCAMDPTIGTELDSGAKDFSSESSKSVELT